MKRHQKTEYEAFCDKLMIVDRVTFLDNLQKLADYDNKYNELFNELLLMSKTQIEIKDGLTFDDWVSDIETIYNFSPNFFVPLYSKVCYITNTKPVEWHDMNTMQASVYAFYKADYQKFMEIVHSLMDCTEFRKWLGFFKFKTKQEFFKKDKEKFELPPVPYIPEDWKVSACALHNE